MKFTLLSYSAIKQIDTYATHTDYTILFFKKMDTILANAYIQQIEKNNYTLKFVGTIFRYVWNGFNLFNGISKGEIELIEDKGKLYVKHKLVYTEVFVLCCLFSIIPLMGLFDTILLRLLSAAIIWAIYFGNMFLANSRIFTIFKLIEKEINQLPQYQQEAKYRNSIKNAPAGSK